ncbi:hypothetical protein [Rubneribacter sp.]|nr:hypothetical protein [Candidatus Rubneribacter avistercoris]
MRNFDLRCPVDGTSALDPGLTHGLAPKGIVIDFPTNACGRKRLEGAATPTSGRRLSSETLQSLAYGTARGKAFDRVPVSQAVVTGFAFVALAMASAVFGL